MAPSDDIPPHVSPFRKKPGGKVFWRYRKGGKTVYLKGEPGSPEFMASYQDAIAGKKAPVIQHPSSAAPKSLKAAWTAYKKSSPEWAKLALVTKGLQDGRASRFLTSPVAEGAKAVWGDMPVADLRRRHIKLIIAQRSDTPHAAKHLLVVIRKIIEAALDEEWIDTDPTYRVSHNPETRGHRPWTFDQLMAFEQRWPPGTTPRLAYALALWLGNRRGDVATLEVDQLRNQLAEVKQGKTGMEVSLPVVPMLEEVLAASDLSGPTVLKTVYGEPFSVKGLGGRMADWTRSAGLPKGCTLHGLRKTLGALAADAQTTQREAMSILGHKTAKEFARYSEGADRKRLAASGMAKVVELWQERLKRAG